MTLFACRFGGAILGAFAAIAATAVLPVHTPAGGALAGVLGACGGMIGGAAVVRRPRALPVIPSAGLARIVAEWQVSNGRLAEDRRRPAA